MVTHQLQVERRTAKAHRPKTDALPLDYATNYVVYTVITVRRRLLLKGLHCKQMLSTTVLFQTSHIVFDLCIYLVYIIVCYLCVCVYSLCRKSSVSDHRLLSLLSYDWATVCKTVRPIPSDRCLSCMSVTLVYCGQTVGLIRVPLDMEVCLGPGHFVLDWDPSPPTEMGTAAPHFRNLLCLRPYKLKPRPMCIVAKRLDGSGCHLVQT